VSLRERGYVIQSPPAVDSPFGGRPEMLWGDDSLMESELQFPASGCMRAPYKALKHPLR
jgi:hypothetical protein